MIFRPFYYYDLGCAAYLLGCGTLGKCAVVDARTDDVEGYAAFANSKADANNTRHRYTHSRGSPVGWTRAREAYRFQLLRNVPLLRRAVESTLPHAARP
jgi:hypothetical protein